LTWIVGIGKHADLVIVRGNPSDSITDIRNVEAVMKNGVLYDPGMLIASAEGTIGQFDVGGWFRLVFITMSSMSFVISPAYH
jgi:hypothetical protein